MSPLTIRETPKLSLDEIKKYILIVNLETLENADYHVPYPEPSLEDREPVLVNFKNLNFQVQVYNTNYIEYTGFGRLYTDADDLMKKYFANEDDVSDDIPLELIEEDFKTLLLDDKKILLRKLRKLTEKLEAQLLTDA